MTDQNELSYELENLPLLKQNNSKSSSDIQPLSKQLTCGKCAIVLGGVGILAGVIGAGIFGISILINLIDEDNPKDEKTQCATFILPEGYTLRGVQVQGGLGCINDKNDIIYCPRELTEQSPEICFELNLNISQESQVIMDCDVYNAQGEYVEHLNLAFTADDVTGTYLPADAPEPLEIPASDIQLGIDGTPTQITLPGIENGQQATPATASQTWASNLSNLASNTYSSLSKGLEHFANGLTSAVKKGADNFVGNATQIGTVAATAGVGLLTTHAHSASHSSHLAATNNILNATGNPADNFDGINIAVAVGAAGLTLGGLAFFAARKLTSYHEQNTQSPSAASPAEIEEAQESNTSHP